MQAVRIQAVGLEVGGRDEAHAVVEQRLEQAVQDHRVGDVGDVKLVEADQPVAPRDAPAQLVAAGRRCRCSSAQLAVHLAHELVEMQPRLALQRHGAEEAVHQEALAAPDAAVHVHAARDRRAARSACVSALLRRRAL